MAHLQSGRGNEVLLRTCKTEKYGTIEKKGYRQHFYTRTVTVYSSHTCTCTELVGGKYLYAHVHEHVHVDAHV